uniref:Uncharacterized protein n=1 Tax=Rhizophagus irregularis (strain DAOM 181602 / DAOM 197198 / MUCL 43194) TaxID=747089 RepID=U9TBN3_RHIID
MIDSTSDELVRIYNPVQLFKFCSKLANGDASAGRDECNAITCPTTDLISKSELLVSISRYNNGH